MYVWLWKRLPGHWSLKLLQCTVLLVITVLLLFTVVFPWLEPRLPFTDVTVDDQGVTDPTGGTGDTVGAPMPARITDGPAALDRERVWT